MDKFSKVLGDGNAKITVGMDLSRKNYGEGFSVFVSVGVSCGQDKLTMKKAVRVCTEFLKDSAPGVKEVVQELYEKEFQQE